MYIRTKPAKIVTNANCVGVTVRREGDWPWALPVRADFPENVRKDHPS